MASLTPCLHFADDWEDGSDGDEEWDEKYGDGREQAADTTAKHRKKLSMVEDAYNRRWQAMVNFGKWITADESRVAGWYHSMMTIGPGMISSDLLFCPIRPIR